MKHLIYIFLLVTGSTSWAQKDSIQEDRMKTLNLNLDNITQYMETNPPLILGIGYTHNFMSKIANNTGNGLYGEIGLNFGSIFHPKMWIGPYIGFKASMGELYNPSLNSNFKQAILDNYNTNLNTSVDNNNKETFKAITTGNENKLFGDFVTTYGAMIMLPIKEDWGISIKLYKGVRKYVFDVYDNTSYEYVEKFNNKYILKLKTPINVGTEIMAHYKNYGFGFYFEKNNLKTAETSYIKLDSFLNPAFFDKYGSEYRMGLKITVYPYFWLANSLNKEPSEASDIY